MKTFLVIAMFWSWVGTQVARAGSEDCCGGWRFNLTPAIVSQGGEYGLGGGVDPEVRFAAARRGGYLSIGARVGAYYARNLFGVNAMPTLRVTIPVGSLELYSAVGVGYGWLPKIGGSDRAEMYRAGFYHHFSKSFGIGAELTYQDIARTNFQFLSLGSMLSFGI